MRSNSFWKGYLMKENNVSMLRKQVGIKTLNFLLLSIATYGIYNIMWLFKTNTVMESNLGRKVCNNIILYILAAFIGWSSLCAIDPSLVFISNFLRITSGVFYIIWAFKAKKAIQNTMLNDYKIDYKMNSFYTFIFNVYYINYCINDLEDEVNKENILSGKK